VKFIGFSRAPPPEHEQQMFHLYNFDF